MNGKDEWVLIAAIDDATSKIPWGEFFTSEDTLNCMTVLQRIVEKYGIPEIIYTDKAGWFGGTTKRNNFNQFINACELLGIKVIFAQSPQAKGRIERAWGTFQDRLIPEMRFHKIKDIFEANKFIQEDFIPTYWNQHNSVQAVDPEVKYRKIEIQEDFLKEIFCLKESRKVKNNHTISWENHIIQLHPPAGMSLQNRHVEIRTYQDRKISLFYNDIKINFNIIEAACKERPLRVYKLPGLSTRQARNMFYKNRENRILPNKIGTEIDSAELDNKIYIQKAS